MRAKFLRLHQVERKNDTPDEACYAFIHAFQRGLLLTWKEQGLLTEEACAAILERVGEI